MKAELVLLKKDGAHKAFPLNNNVIVIGRRHDCDLQIPLPTVSRRHCQITLNEHVMKIQDLGSKAGTFVNNQRVGEDGGATLKAGDQLRVGPLVFVCQVDGKPEKIAGPKKSTPAPRAGKPPAPKKTPAEDDLDLDEDLAGEPKDGLDDSFADLDASGGFVGLDDEEDAKGAKAK
jgi:predicted component of type VI protein secretion system